MHVYMRAPSIRSARGSRAEWLMEVLAAAAARQTDGASAADQSHDCQGATPGIEAAFAQRFMSQVGQTNDAWDLQQQCGTLLHLAGRGHQRAQQLLYEFLGREHDGAWLLAGAEIVKLDGEAGLQFIANYIDELPDDPAGYADELDYLRRVVLPEREGREPERNHDPDALEARRRARAERFLAVSAADVIEEIESDDAEKKRHWYGSWAIYADDESRQHLADRMLSETDAARLQRYLAIFLRRPVPKFDSRLLALAEHPHKEVRRLAMYMLGQQAHPGVRELALRCAGGAQNDNGELRLFCRNFELGDWHVIKTNLRLPPDQSDLHGMFIDLLDVFRDNPEADAEEAMRLIYEHDPCSMCRYSAVRRLIEQDRAPLWMLEECHLDCDEDTRKLAKEALQTPPAD